MAKRTVEQELAEATGIKPKAKEKRQDYLKRMVGGTGELDDDAWKNLSTPAQKWHNAATKAYDADEEIPDFEEQEEAPKAAAKGKKPAAAEAEEEDATAEGAGEDETEEGDDAEEADADESDDDTVKTTKKPAAKKAAAKPAGKPAAKTPAPKAAPAKKAAGKGSKSSGGVQAVLNYVLKNPDTSPADIMAALKKDGITVTISTVSSTRGFFKLVVRFLQDKKLTTKKIFD